jgi:hypothetical protein
MRRSKLTLLALAITLAGAVPAAAQTPDAAPVGSSKQAEYDCSGMTWTALDNCRKLNADNARAGSGPVQTTPRGATNDCSGMVGAPLETCLQMNGAIPPAGNREAKPVGR